MNIDVYKGFGLILIVMGGVLALYTYFILGVNPLTALWIGLVITGASILLTPSQAPRRVREITVFIDKILMNITFFLETLRIFGNNLFKSYDGNVYIFISKNYIDKIPDDVEKNFIIYIDGEPVIRLVSPINKDLVKDFAEPCPAIEYVLIEYLDSADRIECVEEDDRVVVRIIRPILPSTSRLDKTIGGVYGVVAGSIYALMRGETSINSVETSPEALTIYMRLKK
jgi:hypothetical protein